MHLVHLNMHEKSKLNFVLYILFISFVGLITTEASEFPYFCDLKISYYPGQDGQAYEVFHKSNNSVRGKTLIFYGDHPSHGPYKQLGVKLLADVCYKNEKTGQVYVEDPEDLWIKNSDINIQKHKYNYYRFIFQSNWTNHKNRKNWKCFMPTNTMDPNRNYLHFAS